MGDAAVRLHRIADQPGHQWCTTRAGNVAEAGTLVVMAAGIASEANIDWLKSQGYRYLVVSRKRTRYFNPEQAIDIETATGDTVRSQKVLSEDGQEVHLFCYSEARGQKEEAMARRFCELFENCGVLTSC